MKTNKNIEHKIESIFDSGNTIKDVQISPFFKDNTLQYLFSEKEEEQKRIWSWFTPQLQLATLMVFVVLNVFAYTKLDTNTSSDEIDEFAQSYSLKVTEYESLLN